MARRTNTIEPKWMLVFVFFLAGIFLGGLAAYLFVNARIVPAMKLHFPKGTYQYVNPTFTSETTNSGNFSTVNNDLTLRVQGLISAAQKKGDITDAGLYYRDFEPETWLAINTGLQFSPGKLLKLPIVIAYYKLAERDPSVLSQTILFKGPYTVFDDVLASRSTLVVGQTYTVQSLMEEMTANNDNTAADLLFDAMDKNVLNEVFSDLGIDFVEDKKTSDFITIKRYSLFMRVLYNATYLSPDSSEQVLSLFSHSKTPSLLESSLPRSVPFAMRSGGRNVQGGVEIYECDIVYYTDHPYLLCAVAHGVTRKGVETLFTQIGAAIYENTQYRYGQ